MNRKRILGACLGAAMAAALLLGELDPCGRREAARNQAIAEARGVQLATAVATFIARWPDGPESLGALVDEGLVSPGTPVDPWSDTFVLWTADGAVAGITSWGPDRLENTEDDLDFVIPR